jgi:hypothetical protein
MRRLVFLVALVTAFAHLAFGQASEVTLFGSDASAVAYIADDLTIYLWSGEPAAYLYENPAGGFHVYGFNGKHLGWYASGVLRDHNGLAVGARKEMFAGGAKAEPFKGFKQFKPFKSFREFAPFRPFFVSRWSDTFLDEFLMSGRQ